MLKAEARTIAKSLVHAIDIDGSRTVVAVAAAGGPSAMLTKQDVTEDRERAVRSMGSRQ